MQSTKIEEKILSEGKSAHTTSFNAQELGWTRRSIHSV